MKLYIPLSLLCCTLFASCTSGPNLQAVIPEVSTSLFGVPGEFTAVMEHQDVGITSSRFIIQNESHGLLYYYDGTSAVVCSDIDTLACFNSEGAHSDEDRDTALRVTKKTARRLLANEYTFTDYEELETTRPPSNTTAHRLQPFPDIIADQTNSSSSIPTLDQCVMLFKNAKQEKETLCYGDNRTSLYAFTQGSTVAPVTILRQLSYYQDTKWSTEDIKILYEQLKASL